MHVCMCVFVAFPGTLVFHSILFICYNIFMRKAEHIFSTLIGTRCEYIHIFFFLSFTNINLWKQRMPSNVYIYRNWALCWNTNVHLNELMFRCTFILKTLLCLSLTFKIHFAGFLSISLSSSSLATRLTTLILYNKSNKQIIYNLQTWRVKKQ